jgi:hypothetical protein
MDLYARAYARGNSATSCDAVVVEQPGQEVLAVEIVPVASFDQWAD